MKSAPSRMFSTTVLPSTCCAVSYSFWPRRTLMTVEAPTPTIAPKAMAMFMSGKVSARPEMAMPSEFPQEPSGPMWPMKMLSTML